MHDYSQCFKKISPASKAGASLMALLLLAGCVSVPRGPNVMAIPGSGKSYEQFHQDDMICRQESEYRVHPAAEQAVTDRAVGTAVAGTLIGTAAGALIGSASGRAGEGAAIGAGVGLLAGSGHGNDNARRDSRYLQRQYNIVYTQCMYAKGHRVPVPGGYETGGYAPIPQGDYGPPPDYAPQEGYGPPPDYPPY